MRQRLRAFLENPETKPARAFDLLIQALILTSLVTFSIETLPDLEPETRAWLGWIEVVCVLVFTAEYLMRVFAAERPLRFIFSFFGLIDLAAILPFYLDASFDLRSLRSFRLLRLLRAFKLLRYNAAIQRLWRAFVIAREELVLFGCVAILVLYLSAVGIYFFENEAQPEVFRSILDGLWWAVATLTTVGYGDVYPVTAGGKVFTFLVLMVGLGIVAVPTGLVASALSQARAQDDGGSAAPDRDALE